MSSFIQKEKKARKIAVWVIFIMIGIWIVLSIFSFTDSEKRGRPDTQNVTFNGKTALDGKQVFQSYNCMDCHTIVGNGAYFAPDLTKIYKETGPAWLKAYLGSPGTYPTSAIVNVNLQQLEKDGEVEAADLDDYLGNYEGAKRRVERRGGIKAFMPNLQFSADEIDALIAFLKYTSKLNTAGWPPKVIADQKVIDRVADRLESQSGLVKETAAGGNSSSAGNAENSGSGASAADRGKQLTQDLGCVGCHSTDGSEIVGPTFKGLFGSQVTLEDGSTVEADTSYIKESILHPNDDIVKGFPKGVMPSFDGIVTDEQLSDLIIYIQSVK